MSDLTFWAQNRDNWERPGALVRDPASGALIRFLDDNRYDCNMTLPGYCQEDYADTDEIDELGLQDAAMSRAIAAGPVVDDPATRGILLDWLMRVWVDYMRPSVSVEWAYPIQGMATHLVWLHDAERKHRFDDVASALHWALTSPDSPVREGA